MIIRGVRLLTCWDCGFESRRGYGPLTLMSLVCYQMVVASSG